MMDLRSGLPYFLAKNGLIESYPPIADDASCDIAIIGAGITGALLVHSLTEAGFHCTVLDRRDVGQGSTVASTALLQYEIDVELHELVAKIGADAAVRAYRLGLEAIDRIEELAGRLPVDCVFERRDSFYFASRRSHRKQVLAEYECRRQHGFDVDYLDDAALEERFPFTAPGGILSRGDGLIDAFRFTHGLLKQASEKGAHIYDRTAVESFERQGDGFVLQTDRGPKVTARHLIVATGYESKLYLKKPRGNLYSTYAVVSEPMPVLPEWPGHCCIWESARPYFYLRTTPDKRILIGGEDTDYSKDHTSERLMKRKMEALIRRFNGLFPDCTFEPAYNWAGTFGESEDGLAFIGEPPEQPGIAFAMGFGGNGITMSVIAARILTDHYLGRPNPDAAIYRFDR